MRAKELRSIPREDLLSKLSELKKELIKHNAQIATGTTPKSPGQVREIKKTIARILTIAKEKPSTKSKKVEEKIKPKEEKSEE